jgi:hypothetical protein
MAKKALVWKEDHGPHKKHDIHMVCDCETAGSLKGYLYAKMVTLDVPSRLEELEKEQLRVVELPAIAEKPGEPEHWTDGQTIVHSADDIPMLEGDDKIPYADPDWYHVPAKIKVSGRPALLKIDKV